MVTVIVKVRYRSTDNYFHIKTLDQFYNLSFNYRSLPSWSHWDNISIEGVISC